MTQKVVLLDLENNAINAGLIREIIEHYPSVYVFNCSGKFELALEELTEFSAWVTSGQVVVLDTPKIDNREFEYAVVVGQLLALLEPRTHIEVISAMDSAEMLVLMLEGSLLSANLIQIEDNSAKVKHKVPSLETIQQSPDLCLVKQYCDALYKMSGKPNTLEKLKNSVANVLKLEDDKLKHIIGMLINLKIVKQYDDQIAFRKKVLKQWANLDLSADASEQKSQSDAKKAFEFLKQSQEKNPQSVTPDEPKDETLKNFERIDPVQLEVARKLRELKADKPKDIYELRDLLVQMFPKSDVRLLLKELLEKGYIYWDGHEVLYSHEMFLS